MLNYLSEARHSRQRWLNVATRTTAVIIVIGLIVLFALLTIASGFVAVSATASWVGLTILGFVIVYYASHLVIGIIPKRPRNRTRQPSEPRQAAEPRQPAQPRQRAVQDHEWDENTRRVLGSALIAAIVVSAVITLIFFLRSLGPSGGSDRTPVGAIEHPSAATPLVAIATNQLAGASPARDSIIRITPEWGAPLSGVIGACIDWQRQEPVAFEVRDQDGNTMIYPKPSDMPDGTNLEFKNRSGEIVKLVKVQGGQAAWPISFEAGSYRTVGGDAVAHVKIHRREKSGL